MKLLLTIIGFCIALSSLSQTIAPSVINSGGKTNTVVLGVQPVVYTDNIGEVVVATATNNTNILTQGFLQPDMVVVSNTSVTVIPTDVSCADKADGYIRVIIDNLPSNASVQYFWSPSALCPANNCDKITDLSAGSFSVQVKITYTLGSQTKSDSTYHVVQIKDENGLCDLKVYTGVNVNGINNVFTIDNIELYPEASVKIFNRWGILLFSEKNYRNADNHWPRKNEKVIPGTYFYVIENNNGKTRKGWIEVLE